jgi:hypothetical protein
MRALRVIYVLGIAVALALLVVFGVQAFYPEPQSYLQAAIHARNVFYIVLPLGVVFAIGGTFLQRRQGIFGAGLILGGIGTMIYAFTPYGLDNIPKFIGIAVILAVLIFVGYRVFPSLRKS